MNDRKCLPALALLLCAFPAWAGALRLGPAEIGTGLFHGTVNEFLFSEGRAVSRLDWEQKFAPFVYGKAQASLFHVFLEVGGFTSIDQNTGLVHDYDFENPKTNAVTRYSQHKSWLDRHQSLNVSLGYNLSLGRWLLAPRVGYTVFSRCFTGVDGYSQADDIDSYNYPWTPDMPKTKYLGNVLSYEQWAWHLSLGAQVRYQANAWLGLSLDGAYIPYLKLNSEDSHYMRNLRFYDIMKGGQGFSLAVGASFRVSEAYALTAQLGVERYSSSKGIVSYGTIGESDGLRAETSYNSQNEQSLLRFQVGVEL
jgi:outer membrane protease